MKIVDKYGLAEQPFGTVFYEVVDRMVKSGPKILFSHTHWYEGKPFFNGVQDLEPNAFYGTEKDIVVGTEFGIEDEGHYRDDTHWFCSDDSTADYDDDDMFLVLEKDEAIDLIKMMIQVTGTEEYFGIKEEEEEENED